jgi:hypothetical protein
VPGSEVAVDGAVEVAVDGAVPASENNARFPAT